MVDEQIPPPHGRHHRADLATVTFGLQAGLGDGRFGGRQCNLFNPFGRPEDGFFPGFGQTSDIARLTNPDIVPQYAFYDPGNPGYSVDYNNFAPNLGASWRPNVQDGWLRTLLGDPDQATISGGFTRSFNRERFDRFVRDYIARFRFTSITSEQFVEFLDAQLPGAAAQVDAKRWLYEPGMPANAPVFRSAKLDELVQMGEGWKDGRRPSRAESAAWSPPGPSWGNGWPVREVVGRTRAGSGRG